MTAGNPCTGNADCASQTCVAGICQSPPNNVVSYCLTSADCPPNQGYFCSNGACNNS